MPLFGVTDFFFFGCPYLMLFIIADEPRVVIAQCDHIDIGILLFTVMGKADVMGHILAEPIDHSAYHLDRGGRVAVQNALPNQRFPPHLA